MFQLKLHSNSIKSLYLMMLYFSISSSLEATWTSPVALTSTPSDLPLVAVDHVGNTVAVWQGYDGISYRTEASTMPYGGSWSPEVWLSGAGQNINTPSVAVDYDGNAVVVWSRWDGMESVIQAAQLPSGGSWSTPINISAKGYNADSCTIAMDFIGDVGNAVAVWHRYNGSNYIIQAATLPSGGSWTLPADVSPSGEDALVPAVAVDDQGNATITCLRYDGANYDVRSASQLYSQPWGPTFSLSSPGDATNFPSVTVDANGNAMVAFSQYNGSNYVVMTSILPPGGSWSEAVQISDDGQNAYSPLVVMEPGGDATVIWAQFNGSHYPLYSASQHVGENWSVPYALSSSNYDINVYNLCSDLNGNVTAVWDISDGTNTWVQAATLPLGGNWSIPDDISTSGAQANSPNVGVDGSGNVVAVWVELNNESNYVTTSATQAFGN